MALLSRDGALGKATYANHVIPRRQTRWDSRRPLEGVDDNAVSPLARADLNHGSLISPYPFSPLLLPRPLTVPESNPASSILNHFRLALFTLVQSPPQSAMYTITGPSRCVHCFHLAVISEPAVTFAVSWPPLAAPLSLQWMV